jgi:hypothetical protein
MLSSRIWVAPPTIVGSIRSTSQRIRSTLALIFTAAARTRNADAPAVSGGPSAAPLLAHRMRQLGAGFRAPRLLRAKLARHRCTLTRCGRLLTPIP